VIRLPARFWRMAAATATSDLADGVGRTALPLAAAVYTRNPVAISGLTTFTFLPWLLFALPSGAVVDRFDRRHSMAAANLVRGLAAGGLALAVVSGAGGVALLYGVAFVLGTAETVYDSAVRALLPQVVTRDQLDHANSLVTVEETLGQTFIGAPVGSVLFVAATALPFLFGAVGFLTAVVLILTLRGHYRPTRTAPSTLRSEAADGVRWLRQHDLLRGLTVLSAGSAFALTMVEGVLVLYTLETLRLPAGDYGLILLAAGAASLVSGLLAPRLAAAVGRPVALTVGTALTGTAVLLMAFTRNGWVAAGLYAAGAAGVMVWNVLTMSIRQALIPVELFGRVQGSYRTVVWGAIPLGAIAGGALAGLAGLPVVFAVSGLIQLGLSGALARLLRRHAAALTDDRLHGPAAVIAAGSTR
jgi:MFS family permease